ncbi:hypothetical protein HYH03_016821 [Edaphochlamys debaryana]|uniref:Uncharacterized protein n=1 Tax=Edaphochlamys debaryana TaxID=47281 RepID=A0A836BPX3_9CHLO|nr:hypothetical protein HYH03_016821 [Edaphochlamys debaryana]|eukprot:KAG2484407.1 hypothetical protein HYH03_016821 [Edaphochlamys debaryana]
MSRSVLVAVLAAASLALAVAQPTTVGTRFDGFSYASNVIGYVNMTADLCDIQAAVAAGNFDEALSIYSTGKNSFSGLARRTFFRFASYAPSASGAPEPLHDMFTMGRNSTWLDEAIKAALARGDGHLAIGLIHVATMKYMLHEVDEGYNKIANYLADPANGTSFINDASGAPHNVDEGFALWAGGSADACQTLSGVAAKLAKDMGTVFINRPFVNTAVTGLWNELLATARLPTVDIQAYADARKHFVRVLTIAGIQGVAHSAYSVQAAQACGNEEQEQMAQAGVLTHWAYLEPMLVYRRTKPEIMSALASAITAARPNYKTKVYPAVRSLLHSMGRSTREVGTPDVRDVTEGWGCSARAIKSLTL